MTAALPILADGMEQPYRLKAPTNSSVATFRKNGEIFAVTHNHKATGYKSSPNHGVRFDGTTTYKSAFSNRGDNPNAKVLAGYDSNAARNRLPVVFTGENKLKQRYGSINKKDNPISGGLDNSKSRFCTSNQRTFVHHTGAPVGFSNQGIVAETSRWIHKRQRE
eukprot:TRINITY_DN53362_c0_g1_i1.p1 TRINITY_DN53362_c0_g1~~TRINITY_DN53362_c0_g1_i1.p1  ORF type:complete len:184 (+),score=9.89 TRINITY_DN53362_c0_g1_i1:61-552(+)